MKKIGILGGTFDPIHNGHLQLACNAYRDLDLNKVLIMPTGISYLKADKKVSSKEDRSNMVKLAISEYNFMEFSDIEIKRSGNTYTYETMKELKEIYPDDILYYIIGADTLFSIENWKNPELIFDKCILAVMVRDDKDIDDLVRQSDYLKSKYNVRCVILNSEAMDVSSTEVRNTIISECRETAVTMVPDKVYQYILKNKLYI